MDKYGQIGHPPSIINVWTKYDETRLHGNREPDLLVTRAIDVNLTNSVDRENEVKVW